MACFKHTNIRIAFCASPWRTGSSVGRRRGTFFQRQKKCSIPIRITRLSLNEGHETYSKYYPSVRHAPLRVHERVWRPSTDKPSAGVLMLHGHGMHGGWYGELATKLMIEANALVTCFDFPSQGKSDDIDGFRGYLRSADDFTSETYAAFERLSSTLPAETPLFVMGESAGAVFALAFALDPKIARRMRGLILSGAAFQAEKKVLAPSFVLAAVGFLANFFPKAQVPGDGVSGPTWDEAFGDEEAVRLSKRDPLVLYGVPLRIGAAAVFLKLQKNVCSRFEELDVPSLLVLHCRDDTRTEFACSKELIQNAHKVRAKELVAFPRKTHQIFQDIPEVRYAAMNKIMDFVKKSVESGSRIEEALL